MQSEIDFTTRRYEVRHRTTYTYDDDVTACYERGFLAPRDTVSQRVLESSVVVSPEPDLMTTHVDYFGNHSSYVEVRTAHRMLDVNKVSVVEVTWPQVPVAALDEWTVASAAAWVKESVDPVTRADFGLASPLVTLSPAVASYAASTLAPDRPLGQALVALYEGIYSDFEYKGGVTTVRTTLAELLELRQGVCQDFAHLAIGCLRSVGLPARYVSGYLETVPPPGKPKLAGSDASHAWVSVLVPGDSGGPGFWVDLDPTNNHFADSRYVVTAWGRDFRDVSPLKGVVATEASASTLDVGVDVIRLP